MNLSGIRREIEELKNSIIWKHEPVCKALVLGAEVLPRKRLQPTGKLIHVQGLLSFFVEIAVKGAQNKVFFSKS